MHFMITRVRVNDGLRDLTWRSLTRLKRRAVQSERQRLRSKERKGVRRRTRMEVSDLPEISVC